MKYIFTHGALSPHQEDSIQSFIQSGYTHILYVKDLPPLEWRDVNMKVARWTEDDAFGRGERERESQLYGVSNLGEGRGSLLYLKFKQDYDAIIDAFPELVISSRPLTSVVELPGFTERDILFEDMRATLNQYRVAVCACLLIVAAITIAASTVFLASAS